MSARKSKSFSKLGKDLASPSSESKLLHEKESYDARRIAAETRSVELKTDLQEWITKFVPAAVKGWLIALMALILLDSININAKKVEWFDFDIETAVMAAIVGSTTIAVVGLVHSAIKGIFGKDHE